MRWLRSLIHEARTGWHQGAVNRHEAEARRHNAVLVRMGEKPHRPGNCKICRGRS